MPALKSIDVRDCGYTGQPSDAQYLTSFFQSLRCPELKRLSVTRLKYPLNLSSILQSGNFKKLQSLTMDGSLRWNMTDDFVKHIKLKVHNCQVNQMKNVE
jgi:hypothetical protein